MNERDDTQTFRQITAGDRFAYGVELVTTRGISEPDVRAKPVELGEALAQDPRLGWVSITDSAGGHPMISADWVGRKLRERGVEVVLHLSCKDLNRNGLESRAWQYAADGFNNILAITGDYPVEGHGGIPAPVFDLDAVGLIAMIEAMNRGMEIPARKGGTEKLPKTDFYVGCAVSPFKQMEAELMPQYFKLLRKIRAGARWVIPQLGYDMRKFHEIKLLLESAGLQHIPVIGNVYVLNKVVAGMFCRNDIPGCVVSEVLKAQVDKYAAGEDKGRGFFRELAAKQLAVFKGLGFAAGYVGGIHSAKVFSQVLDIAESFAPDDWKEFARELQYPQPDEFYLFERDETTGLGKPDEVNHEYARSLDRPSRTGNVTLGYRLSHWVHDKVFTPGKGMFPAMQKMYGRLSPNGTPGVTGRMLHALERMAKFVGYGCKDCGDCSLPDCAYQCPMHACSKSGRNGPCGGSKGGRCELDDKTCMWVRAYERMKYYHGSEEMLEGPPVYYNAELKGSSSWANTFLGRDHHAQKAEQDTLPEAADTTERDSRNGD